MKMSDPNEPFKFKNTSINGSERAGVGGTFSHGPLCKCYPCSARRRKQEAIVSGARVGGMLLAAQHVPEKAITDKNGVKKAAPKDIRERVAQFLQLDIAFPSATKAELAEKMGLTAKRLYEIIQKGRETGLIKFVDPIDRIDYELIPKIVENLNYFLDAKDKTVTIEAAKGTIFKAYQDSKGISDSNSMVLALKIEMPEAMDAKILTGHIVGKPKALLEE